MQLTDNAVLKKIETVRVSGQQAYNNGTVKLFEGFSPSLAFRPNVSLVGIFQTGTLLQDVYEEAEAESLNIFLAGSYFPLHSTLLEADYEGQQDGWSSLDSLWREIAEILSASDLCASDASLQFSHLMLDASGNLLLMADEIPPTVLSVRTELAGLYEKYGLKVRPMDNILHSTIGRLYSSLGSKTPDALRHYFNRIRDLQARIERPAMQMKIIRAYHGPALDLLTEFKK